MDEGRILNVLEVHSFELQQSPPDTEWYKVAGAALWGQQGSRTHSAGTVAGLRQDCDAAGLHFRPTPCTVSHKKSSQGLRSDLATPKAWGFHRDVGGGRFSQPELTAIVQQELAVLYGMGNWELR